MYYCKFIQENHKTDQTKL